MKVRHRLNRFFKNKDNFSLYSLIWLMERVRKSLFSSRFVIFSNLQYISTIEKYNTYKVYWWTPGLYRTISVNNPKPWKDALQTNFRSKQVDNGWRRVFKLLKYLGFSFVANIGCKIRIKNSFAKFAKFVYICITPAIYTIKRKLTRKLTARFWLTYFTAASIKYHHRKT